MKSQEPPKTISEFARKTGEGLLRAAEEARRVARMHGTKIVVLVDGKVVERDPDEPSAEGDAVDAAAPLSDKSDESDRSD